MGSIPSHPSIQTRPTVALGKGGLITTMYLIMPRMEQPASQSQQQCHFVTTAPVSACDDDRDTSAGGLTLESSTNLFAGILLATRAMSGSHVDWRALAGPERCRKL